MVKKLTFEEKIQYLNEMGARPQLLQKRNPLFFKNLLLRINGVNHTDHPLNPNSYFFEIGNPSLWEKCKPKEKPKYKQKKANYAEVTSQGMWEKIKRRKRKKK